MSTTKYVTYNDFSKGEYGEIGEFRAPMGMYSGTNVVLYNNGMLGPRAGVKHIEQTGGPTMNGQVWGIWPVGAINKPLMINVDDKVYSTTEDNYSLGTVTEEATLDAAPTTFIKATWYDPNGTIYFTNPGDSVYGLEWLTSTLTNIPVRNGGADNAGTDTIFLCKDRLYAAGDGHQLDGNGGQYVYVSAPADFSNFAGGETFQVGYFNTVRSMAESQNSLMFSCLEATNNIGSGVGWYSLVGATPQGSLRRVNVNLGSAGQNEVVAADNGNIYFWSGWTTAFEDDPYLVSQNGAKFDEESFKHLRLIGGNRFGYYNARDKTLLYMSDIDGNGFMRCNGAWSKINIELDDIAGPIAPTEAGATFLITQGGVATDVKVYEMISRPDKPGIPNVNSMPGDDTLVPLNAFFSLPAFKSDTKDLRVRKVYVNFMKWDTDHTGNNEFTVGVRTFDQYNLPAGAASGEASTTQTWSEDQSYSSSGGTLDRFVARIGQQGKSAAFQISITGIKGVAIESITVEYDEESAEGRTK